jgi:hypothetical protein
MELSSIPQLSSNHPAMPPIEDVPGDVAAAAPESAPQGAIPAHAPVIELEQIKQILYLGLRGEIAVLRKLGGSPEHLVDTYA